MATTLDKPRRVRKYLKKADPGMPPAPTPTDAAAMGGAAMLDATPLDGINRIEFDRRIQLGRTGLKQYGGFIFEEFLPNLRGREGAKAYREVVDNSPLVGGILRLLELTLRQVNRYVEPFSDDAEDVQRAERIDQALDDMSVSWADMMAEITTMLPYGWAATEIIWKTCEGWTEDGMTRSRYDDGLIMPRKIYLMAQDTLFRWTFDYDGGVKALVQLAPPDYVMRTIPIEKMLLFRPHIEKGNPEGHSLLRAGYFSWVMIKRLVEFESITAERDATGIPVARIPGVNMIDGATPAQTAVYTKFKQIVENLRIDDQAGVVIPSDVWADSKEPMFSVELLGSRGSSRTQHFPFGETITRHEVRLAISMCADIMLLGHDKVGSFSLSRDKRTMLADALGAWLDAIVGVFNRHLFPRIYAYNGWPMDRLCQMGHGGVQTDDLDILAGAILKLSQAGMPLFPDKTLENHIRAEAGLPETSEEDELLGDEGEEPPDLSRPAGEETHPSAATTAVAAKPVQPGAMGTRKGRSLGVVPAGFTKALGHARNQASAVERELRKYRHQPRSNRGTYHPRSGDIASAVQLLADRAQVGRNGQVNHGFHVIDKAPYEYKAVTPAAVDAAPTQRVQHKDLTATQPMVRRDNVRQFIDNPGIVVPGQRDLSGQLVDRPIVVRAGGKDYIHDGHHRLSARVLMGYQDSMARIVELEPPVAPGGRPEESQALPPNQGTPHNAGTGPAAVAPAYQWDPNTALVKTPPWKVEQRGDKYVVVGVENGKVYGTHDTKEEAAAQARALYANVHEKALAKAHEALLATMAALKAQAEATTKATGPQVVVQGDAAQYTAALQQIADAVEAIRDANPNIDVHVEVPAAEPVVQVHVPAAEPVVNVAPSSAVVQVAAPAVQVDVAAPQVHIEQPPPTPPKPMVQEVKRDAWGRIEEIVERPKREDE